MPAPDTIFWGNPNSVNPTLVALIRSSPDSPVSPLHDWKIHVVFYNACYLSKIYLHQLFSMACLAAHRLLLFLEAVCSGSLGMLHTALQYSLYLCSGLTNTLINMPAVSSLPFPYGCGAPPGVSASVIQMDYSFTFDHNATYHC